MTLLSKTRMKKFVETKPETSFFHEYLFYDKHAFEGSSQKTSSMNRWFSRISKGTQKLYRAQHVHGWRLGQSSQYCQIARCTMTTNSDRWNKNIWNTNAKQMFCHWWFWVIPGSRSERWQLLECCHDISNSSEFLTNLRLDSFELGIRDCISKGTNDDGKPYRRN